MIQYSDYKKTRLIYETFTLIKSGKVTTKKELANLFNKTEDTIENYIEELNSEFNTDICWDRSEKRYVIKQEGIMSLLKRNNPLTIDDIIIILYSLVNTQDFMETKINIVKNSLMNLLPEEEVYKLKNLLYYEKNNDTNEGIIEFNISNIRKAITFEKKISFLYSSASGKNKNYKITPYSFACEFGKFYIIGKPDYKDSLMHFRIDRVSALNVLEEDGKRECEFNINNYMKKCWYMYGGEETKVIVKFKKECKSVVKEKNMCIGEVIEENDEYFIYEFICNGTKGIKLWLMGFGHDAEILEPRELRDEIKEEVIKMMGIYS